MYCYNFSFWGKRVCVCVGGGGGGGRGGGRMRWRESKRGSVQCCFTSTETTRLIRDGVARGGESEGRQRVERERESEGERESR